MEDKGKRICLKGLDHPLDSERSLPHGCLKPAKPIGFLNKAISPQLPASKSCRLFVVLAAEVASTWAVPFLEGRQRKGNYALCVASQGESKARWGIMKTMQCRAPRNRLEGNILSDALKWSVGGGELHSAPASLCAQPNTTLANVKTLTGFRKLSPSSERISN